MKNDFLTSFEAWRQRNLHCISCWMQTTFRSRKNCLLLPSEDFSAIEKTFRPPSDILQTRKTCTSNSCWVKRLIFAQLFRVMLHLARRVHYGFQSTGAHFLDFSNIKLDVDERPKDKFQRLMSFIKDNPLGANSNITHHGEASTVYCVRHEKRWPIVLGID